MLAMLAKREFLYRTLSTSKSSDKIDDEFLDLVVRKEALERKIADVMDMNEKVLSDVQANDVATNQILTLQATVKNSLKKLRDYASNLGNRINNGIPELEFDASNQKKRIDQIEEEVSEAFRGQKMLSLLCLS